MHPFVRKPTGPAAMLAFAAALGMAAARPAQAQDRIDIPSANGLVFDVETNDAGVNDGGQDAFDDWGQLYLRVQDPLSGALLTDPNFEDNELGDLTYTDPISGNTITVEGTIDC